MSIEILVQPHSEKEAFTPLSRRVKGNLLLHLVPQCKKFIKPKFGQIGKLCKCIYSCQEFARINTQVVNQIIKLTTNKTKNTKKQNNLQAANRTINTKVQKCGQVIKK